MNRALRLAGFIDALYGEWPASDNLTYIDGYIAGCDARLTSFAKGN